MNLETTEAWVLGGIGAAQGAYKYLIKQETHNETRIGTAGWMAIGAFVVGWDLLAEESLTHSFRRGLDNPKMRPLLIGGLAVTGLHLLHLIPDRVDPFYIMLHRD